MKIICITGGLGTGKTTVANIFRSLNYPVIDFDKLTIIALERCKDKIIKEFGNEVIIKGKVCKDELKKIVFKNKEKRKKLEKITHPCIFYLAVLEILWLVIKGHSIIFMEVPLFFEVGLEKYFSNILVICSDEKQKMRVINRDGETLLLERINSQLPLSLKKLKSTYIIDNDGSLEDTKAKVLSLRIRGTSIYIWILFLFAVFMTFL
ncbi:Dephospho-CoA kinase [Dictyocoela muelleri]|nr:Dephospho-CoA kinase [Dictyocoela muelleri]